jgi:hypothetical protein
MTSKDASKLRLEYVSIDQLKKWQDNPRVMPDDQAKALRANIQRFGIVDPIIINKSNMIIGGHQRLEAAIQLGIKQVPVVQVDVKGKDLKVLNLALNRISGDWDEAKLAPLLMELKDLPEIDLTGFQPQEIANLIADLQLEEGKEDVIPEPPAEPISKLGDVWQCGRHRVMCGDSTKQNDFMQYTDLTLTDPPYNVGLDYGEKTDDMRPNWLDWCHSWFDALKGRKTIITVGAINLLAWVQAFPPYHVGIWYKGLGANTHGRISKYWAWEPILFYGENFGRHRHIDVFEYTAGGIKIEHPAPKPTGLWLDLIEHYSEPDQTIYDPFLGSGTTLIAAEKLGRICYGVEIEPRYVDVAVKRWEQFTGQKAEKLGTT